MNLLRMFGRRSSAPVARERLQILLAHERKSACNSDLISVLHREVIGAVSKHIALDPDQVEITIQHRGTTSVLEINIVLEPSVGNDELTSRVGGRAA